MTKLRSKEDKPPPGGPCNIIPSTESKDNYSDKIYTKNAYAVMLAERFRVHLDFDPRRGGAKLIFRGGGVKLYPCAY